MMVIICNIFTAAIGKIWLNGITDMIISAHVQHTNP